MHRRTALLAVLGLSLLALAAPSSAAAADFPLEGQRLPQLRRDGGRDPGRGSGPPRHRRRLLDRQELPEPQHLGGQGLRQRGRRRERARGAVRRAAPRPRAPHGRADARDPALAERRLREQRRDHRARRHARGLDHLQRQPGRRGVRPHRFAVPRVAQEPPAELGHDRGGHRPQPQLRLSLGLLRRLVGLEVLRHLSRLEGVVRARDARRARLHRQSRGRWAPADQDGDHVPHGRRGSPLAVRLHHGECPPT